MSVTTGSIVTQLSAGDRFYAYSGPRQGDISVPASIKLIDIPNIGLRDSFIKIKPYFGARISNDSLHTGLGILVTIDGVEVYRNRYNVTSNLETQSDNEAEEFEIFVPRGSKLEVDSLNTTVNNLQTRGVILLGWYL
jgi:hypothetical protein